MSCEMCGKFAGPDLVEAEVEGAKMYLCKKCAKFGTELAKHITNENFSEETTEVTFVKNTPGEKGPSVEHMKIKTGSQKQLPTPKRKGYRDALDVDEVLVDNYGEVIKSARKELGLSLEEFAQMINEKSSLLQKIEKSEFHPSNDLIKKIERKLEINLREEASAPILTSFTSQKETTLGDVVKLKKKKR